MKVWCAELLFYVKGRTLGVSALRVYSHEREEALRQLALKLLSDAKRLHKLWEGCGQAKENFPAASIARDLHSFLEDKYRIYTCVGSDKEPYRLSVETIALPRPRRIPTAQELELALLKGGTQ